ALKSAHGTYLRGRDTEPVKVDLAEHRKKCEHWTLDIVGDRISLRPYCSAPSKFLRVNPDGRVDLADLRYRDEEWTPVKREDGSWSLLTRYGFLTAGPDATVRVVNKNAEDWEKFWLEKMPACPALGA
ncbi:hypothetical protein PENTCL1PPCAC_21326, partial [Pristionchus entomophagus]